MEILMKILIKTLLSLTIFALAFPSFAQTEINAEQSMNMYAGPGDEYPPIEWINAGEDLTLYGCISGLSWCDVSSESNRGWVKGNFLGITRGDDVIYLNVYPSYFNVPIIYFNRGIYWNRYYYDRPWFRDRDDHPEPIYRPREYLPREEGHDWDRRRDLQEHQEQEHQEQEHQEQEHQEQEHQEQEHQEQEHQEQEHQEQEHQEWKERYEIHSIDNSTKRNQINNRPQSSEQIKNNPKLLPNESYHFKYNQDKEGH